MQSLLSLTKITGIYSSVCEAFTRFVLCDRCETLWAGPKDENNSASEAPTIVAIKRTNHSVML